MDDLVGWVRAADEELVCCGIGVAHANESYEDAKRKLRMLVQWHVDVATDPEVKGGFVLVPQHNIPFQGKKEGADSALLKRLQQLRYRYRHNAELQSVLDECIALTGAVLDELSMLRREV